MLDGHDEDAVEIGGRGIHGRAFALLVAAFLACSAAARAQPNGAITETYAGRDLLVHVPAVLPPRGRRALVVVLHGGLGNAERIEAARSESGLRMDAVADADGFVVAYLNGSRASAYFDPDARAWNSGGGCCGRPAETNVDDVAYVTGAIALLESEYGIDPKRVYGIGHSNGAMMTQRVMCETGVYAAAVAIAGPLDTGAAACPAARGKRILAIHGADDENVPLAGGLPTRGISGVSFASEEVSRRAFVASGATYVLDVVAGAGHVLADVDAAIERGEGLSLAEKAARFFGLGARS